MKKTPLTCKIPDKIKKQIADSKLNDKCCVGGDCDGVIQWHHAFTYAGKRQNEPWCILGICEKHHREEAKYRDVIFKEMARRVTLEEVLLKYPKATDLIRYVNNK